MDNLPPSNTLKKMAGFDKFLKRDVWPNIKTADVKKKHYKEYTRKDHLSQTSYFSMRIMILFC